MTRSISPKEYRTLNRRGKNKFGARRVRIDGITFDSKREAARYGELKLLQRAGKIRDLRAHVNHPLTVNKVTICAYEADFVYEDTTPGLTLGGHPITHLVLEDVKGVRTREFVIKKRLVLAVYSHDVKEIR